VRLVLTHVEGGLFSPMNLAIKPDNRAGNPIKACCFCLYSVGFTTGSIGRAVGLSPAMPEKWLKKAGVFKSSKVASPVRMCVSCLYSIGYGLGKIERVTGYNRGAAAKWLKKCDVYFPEIAAVRLKMSVALHHRRKRDERLFPISLGAFSVKCRVEKMKQPPRTDAERAEQSRLSARAYYHANKRAIYQRNNANPKIAMARRLRQRLWKVTKGKFREVSTMQLVGCTLPELIAHIESRFKPGMTWENRKAWHIDHIRPCASFDLSQLQEQRACFHYTNLQPLWASENLWKSAALPFD